MASTTESRPNRKKFARLEVLGIHPSGEIHENLDAKTLIEISVELGEGNFTAHRALVTETGTRTGRSPNDKFIVHEKTTAHLINWGNVNVPIDSNVWNNLRRRVVNHLSASEKLWISDLYCGAEPVERLPIQVVTESAWHAAFARNMFIRPTEQEISDHTPEFTVLHAPWFQAQENDGVNSEAFVIVNYQQGEVIIGGTRYAGEIKKSIFSVMNLLLPQRGILPMHCSANTTENVSAIFFGLSGTGKTTLSADPNRKLVGDDEHGWGSKGVFNFEGGCYAKLIDLSEEDEPAIFSTTRRFGTVLENIILDVEGIPDFSNTTKTENTRGSYPIEFIDNRTITSTADHPKHVVFLTCDAFGVLPPISRLTPAQAAYHFISGYTAKVAGTEVGVTEPRATFSACFGEPFMPMHPGVYANLLSEKIAEHGSSVWLINTGWTAGPHGIGHRMRIPHTRSMLNAALDGKLEDVEYSIDQRFGIEVPTSCPSVPKNILIPKNTWNDKNAFDRTANKLTRMFNDNFKRYEEGVSEDVRNAAPKETA